jgi:hypothetical protein
MPETHRLSYVGDPSLISAFLRLLEEEGVRGEWDNPPIERREGSDLARHEPYSILARGQHDVATAGIERAITRFRHRFPGQADIHDDGQMPDTHRSTTSATRPGSKRSSTCCRTKT